MALVMHVNHCGFRPMQGPPTLAAPTFTAGDLNNIDVLLNHTPQAAPSSASETCFVPAFQHSMKHTFSIKPTLLVSHEMVAWPR
jgi:hypothetical protein